MVTYFTGSSSTNGKEFAQTKSGESGVSSYTGKNKQGSERTNYLCIVTVTQNTGGRAEN